MVIIAIASVLSGAAVGVRWALRPAQAVEYPADPADQAPASAPFDLSGLPVPRCPGTQPGAEPVSPGRPGDDKLVEWGAVRFVRCTYMFAIASGDDELMTIDIVEDPAQVTDAVRVLRRMITPAQFTRFFGVSDSDISVGALFPTHRYLFQYPDDHVMIVDHRFGYYRDDILRQRWSVRGSSVQPLAVPGVRQCGGPVGLQCLFDGLTATVPG